MGMLIGLGVSLTSCEGTKPTGNGLLGNLSRLDGSGGRFADADGDGLGGPSKEVVATDENPAPGVADNTDCDDHDKYINPKSTIPDALDYRSDFNCDGLYGSIPSMIKKSLSGKIKTYLYEWQPTPQGGGKMIEVIREGDEHGRVLESSESLYNEKGRILFVKERDGDLSTPVLASRSYDYNEKGLLILLQFRDGDETAAVTASEEHTYDEQGNKLSLKVHKDDLASPVLRSLEWTYDARNINWPLIKISRSDNFEEEGYWITRKVHNNGDLSSAVTESAERVFDEHGNLLISKRHLHGDLSSPVTIADEWSYEVDVMASCPNKEMTAEEAGGLWWGNSFACWSVQQSYNGDVTSSVIESVERSYDEHQNVVIEKWRQGDLSSRVMSTSEMTYDEVGNMMTRKFHQGELAGAVQESEEWEYDPLYKTLPHVWKRNIADRQWRFYKYHSRDLSSPVTYSFENKWDAQGNIISYEEHHGDVTTPITNSVIYQYSDILLKVALDFGF